MSTSSGWLFVRPSSELHTKSSRTQRGLRRTLVRNLTAGLARGVPDAEFRHDQRRRLLVRTADVDAAAGIASRTMGVRQVAEVTIIREEDFPRLVDEVAGRARERVVGRTFAVRVGRRGGQPWRAGEAEAAIGARLVEDSAGVNLTAPEVLVRVEAYGDQAFLYERSWDGPGGLPIGAQDHCLALLSGGFDSAVAAWMLASRGCVVDFCHFTLECAQTEQALGVAYDLWSRWGAGWDPVVWILDFQPVRETLLERIDSKVRQIVLKELMMAAADRLADRVRARALATGEALGQVSTQTLANLAEIDRASNRLVVRPLIGMDKETIIRHARRIGTHDLSARTKEVCNLSVGPVVVAPRRSALEGVRRRLPEDLLDGVLATPRVIAVPEWTPGVPGVPVVAEPPSGTEVIDASAGDGVEDVVGDGPVAVRGRGAARVGCRLQRSGRTVYLVDTAASIAAVA